MLQSKMIVYADFPTWNTLSAPVKSLINFFMEGASCFFKGKYSGGVLQSMSGNVRSKLRSIMQIDDDPSEFALKEGVGLDIVYSDQSIPSTASTFLPDCNTTLVEKQSTVKVCKIDTEDVETYSGGISLLDSIPVVLTPMVRGNVNNNPNEILKDLDIEDIIEVPVYTKDLEFIVDYQLRTSSFYIRYDDNLGADVYYKIGICPLDKKYSYSNFSDTPVIPGLSLGDIKNLLQNDELLLNKEYTQTNSLFYKLLNCSLVTDKDYFNSDNYDFVSSLIIPLVNSDNQLVGFGYIKLFNQDGTEFTVDVRDKDVVLYCRPTEEGDPEPVSLSSVTGLHLSITDQNIDGGYIHTAYTKGLDDDLNKPLLLLSKQDGSTLGRTVTGTDYYQISSDGETWADFTNTITLNINEYVYVRAKQQVTNGSITSNQYIKFSMTGVIEAYNNPYSLLTPDFIGVKDLSKFIYVDSSTNSSPYQALSYCFSGCSSLRKAPKLPATRVSGNAYYSMFNNCSSLRKAPKLPADIIGRSCYSSMFNGCVSLVECPAIIPSKTLYSSCYYSMFQGCSSLKKAPELPADIISDGCYGNMFYGCTSLSKFQDVLPATILRASCYAQMFYGCSSLIKSPELPAINHIDTPIWATDYTHGTLYNCYHSMFSGCSSLRKVPDILPSTSLHEYCYSGMFEGCSSLRKAPELPATKLANSCYTEMFKNCTSLVEAPELPATDLPESECYGGMFEGCTSLLKGPSILPSMKVQESGYQEMFKDCSSLLESPELPATTLASSCYRLMFYGCSSLRKAPDILPATVLYEYCYYSMFQGCSSLIKAPKLPATSLARFCYNSMFYGCSSLIEAPELPARNMLNYNSYSSMFAYCTSLEEAPDLPAATGYYESMFSGCSSLRKAPVISGTSIYCESMFKDCTSLEVAPELPSVALLEHGYESMFEGCISLRQAPDLPASRVLLSGYRRMFYGCTSLNYVKVHCTNIDSWGVEDWLYGVASSGDLYCPPELVLPDWAIPTGWTRHDTAS